MLSTKFPSLQKYLASSPYLALYFASSWCPDCTSITPIVSSMYTHKGLNVVYVSSDNSKEQMEKYYEKEKIPFPSIPFENTEERTELKLQFGACASKEVPMIEGMKTRKKYGIPTLVVLDCKSQDIAMVMTDTEIKEDGLKSLEI